MRTSYIKSVISGLYVFFFSLTIFGQVTTPRVPSPAAMVQQTVGISTVTVHYSRPSVNGREIWGALVPYGWNRQGFGNGNSAPWRAGANENTFIEFSHAATVEGHEVPAGSYGLFFTINPDNSGQVILSKDYRAWGSFFYDSSRDLFRAPIQIRNSPETEMLTYNFINNTKNGTELVLDFEKKEFPVKISFDVDKIVMKNAAEELTSTAGFNWIGFFTAANYSLQNNTDLDQGLKWIDQAITQNRSFVTLNTKSAILKKMGKNDQADKMQAEAFELSTENELNNYGYQLLNNKQMDMAIDVLKINTQRHPKSANTWDSLGEAYFLNGDKKNAAANFKKSLSLNPPANVKANSEKFLKQMGEL